MKRIYKHLWLILAAIILSAGSVFAQTAQPNENEQKARSMAFAIQNGATEPSVFYNTACFFALAGKTDEAFNYLDQAVSRGFANVEHIKKDSDLISLRDDVRWQKIIEKAEAKQREQQNAFWNKKEFWNNPALKTPYRENISDEEKIAGLSKFWSEIKYNFANFDLIPDVNWDALYLEYIPKARNTKTTLEYYRVLQELCARLRDGHTNVYMPEQLWAETAARPLIRTGLIEDKVLIVGVYSDELKQNGITTGQEIVEINGVPVKKYAAEKIEPYQSASTPQDLQVRVFDYALLNGSIKEPIELTLRDAKGNSFKKTLPRLKPEERRAKIPRTAFEYKLLSGNVAYVALNAFDDVTAAEMFEAKYDEISKADAIIFDVRNNGGGSSGVGYRVLAHLTDKPFKGSSWYTRQYRPTFRAWERTQETYGREAGDIAPNGKRLYRKPVIVLTSPRTYSAAEDFAVAFISMKRGIIMGEPTGGSTGQPLFFELPGGGSARVCTKRDRFADGADFVGKGIQPDKLVSPTIADFRAGRDTTLEAALDVLKKP
jgi:carboxyl-terminal processing protease